MLSPIPDILDELRAGRMVVVVDAEDRENEGDLMIAAEHITPEAVNFMLTVARGYLFLSLTEHDCNRLDLHPQTERNTSVRGTPLTVSIDGHPKHGFTTGVSAHERARTIRLAIDPNSRPDDFVRPGHINPLRSRDGGVLVRTGHTEALIDLCRLAGCTPAAVGIEVMREDGHMARVPDLEKICSMHGLKMCSIEQLIEFRLQRERLIRRMHPVQGTPLETALGTFNLIAYETFVDALPQVVLTVGDVGQIDAGGQVKESEEPVLVRMHRRNVLGDLFLDVNSSNDGPTAWTLHAAMQAIQHAGQGVIVYLRPEGVGDALDQRLTALRTGGMMARNAGDDLIGFGANTVPGHLREFGIGGQILRDLGIRKMRLLTNHRKSLPGLDAFGLEIVEHVPLRLDNIVSMKYT